MGRSCKLSKQGLEEARKALKKKAWKQAELADFAECSRQTIVKFFKQNPIDKDNFRNICDKLGLSIEDVLELEIENPVAKDDMYAQQEKADKSNIKLINDELSVAITTLPQINDSKANKKTPEQQSKAVIILSGKLLPGERIELSGREYDVEEVLKQLNKQQGFDLQIIDILEGSIKIIVSDFPENLDRLNALFQSGKLLEVSGIPVEKVEVLNNRIEESDTEEDKKLQLIERIVAGEVSGNDLVGADLSGAFLYNADLQGINLKEANLAGADLSEANLEKANLAGADLSGADLQGADLQGVIKSRGTSLQEAFLQGVFFWGANLRRTNLQGANLAGADLSEADLREADLQGANLQWANLQGANLQRADLREADLREVKLLEANLQGAKLTTALVMNALFGGATGITPEMRRDLENRGAIFGDKPRATV